MQNLGQVGWDNSKNIFVDLIFLLKLFLGNELCMGKCINTPGSFLCTCPEGYQVMSDGITCKGK